MKAGMPVLLGKNAAFREWQRQLRRGDKLPRGKFFKGKVAGKKRIVFDEAHRAIKSYRVKS